MLGKVALQSAMIYLLKILIRNIISKNLGPERQVTKNHKYIIMVVLTISEYLTRYRSKKYSPGNTINQFGDID